MYSEEFEIRKAIEFLQRMENLGYITKEYKLQEYRTLEARLSIVTFKPMVIKEKEFKDKTGVSLWIFIHRLHLNKSKYPYDNTQEDQSSYEIDLIRKTFLELSIHLKEEDIIYTYNAITNRG